MTFDQDEFLYNLNARLDRIATALELLPLPEIVNSLEYIRQQLNEMKISANAKIDPPDEIDSRIGKTIRLSNPKCPLCGDILGANIMGDEWHCRRCWAKFSREDNDAPQNRQQ